MAFTSVSHAKCTSIVLPALTYRSLIFIKFSQSLYIGCVNFTQFSDVLFMNIMFFAFKALLVMLRLCKQCLQVCVYICMYVYMYVYNIYMCVCLHTHVYVYMYDVCMYKYIYIYIYIHIIYIYIYMGPHIHIYIYTYIYIYIYLLKVHNLAIY